VRTCISCVRRSALDGSFILLSFRDRDDPDPLYVEYVTGALHIEASKR
jgi:hypothetical protein